MAAENYFKTAGDEPRDSLLKALQYFNENLPSKKRAIDLGTGNGRDTYALLQSNWNVQAYDRSEAAIANLKAHPQLKTSCCSFETIPWETLEVELVNASFALPFCPMNVFPQVWNGIENALVEGGVFAGHFFGNEDDWKRLILFSKEEIKCLFDQFHFEHFEEKKFKQESVSGQQKDWHIFEIVATKKRI